MRLDIDLSSRASALVAFEAGNGKGAGARPNMDQDWEFIGDNMIRVWNRPPPEIQNERWLDFYTLGELHGFDKLDALSFEYTICIGEDVAPAMTAEGAKLPGPIGSFYQPENGFPVSPSNISYSAWWTVMLHHGRLTNGVFPLSLYPFLVCNPTVMMPQTNGAGYYDWDKPFVATPGMPAWQGMYGGSGNPQSGGWAPDGRPFGMATSGHLVPGKRHRARVVFKLNTVKDRNFIPAPTGIEGLNQALANANKDGLLRIELDGKIVAEWTDVAFRGQFGAMCFAMWHSVYYGGKYIYVTAPSHVEYGQAVITDEGLDQPQQQPEGGNMDQVITLVVPTGTKVTSVETPDGKPPAGDAGALKTMTDNRDAWKTYAQSLVALAQKYKDADAAKADGQDMLDVPQPPVV